MIPPTSIDGTDITGATIDGTDVTEITVDGQTVFSAETLPVAYSDLIAWYPFDSATYGGSNADDVTALFNSNQSGDSTAYDGTVFGATYQSSGGVTDINAGANSGAFDFSANTDVIEVTGFSITSDEWTLCAWVDNQNLGGNHNFGNVGKTNLDDIITLNLDNGDFDPFFRRNASGFNITTVSASTGYVHGCVTYNDGSVKAFLDGVQVGTLSVASGSMTINEFGLGNRPPSTTVDDSAGAECDDFRVYTKALTQTQIADIYANTEP